MTTDGRVRALIRADVFPAVTDILLFPLQKRKSATQLTAVLAQESVTDTTFLQTLLTTFFMCLHYDKVVHFIINIVRNDNGNIF